MTRRRTLQQFTDKGNTVHNFKYDYSKFIYLNKNTKGIIICPIHKEFTQSPHSHLNGSGCYDCGIISSILSKRITFEEFYQAGNKIFNGKYDYSKFIFEKNPRAKGIIICPIHGDFKKSITKHIHSKQGCQKCAKISRINKKTKTLEKFIQQAIILHPDENYNYEKFKYKGCNIEGTIICPIHGDFEQTPTIHLLGLGCGCQKCGIITRTNAIKSNLEEFVDKSNIIHDFEYNYDKFIYINNSTKGIIICKIDNHGEFLQKPACHLRGVKCYRCKNKNEQIVRKFLENNNLEIDKEYKIKLPINVYDGGRYTLPDFYIPSLNLIIEYNGEHHFRPVRYSGISQEKADLRFKRQQLRDQQLKQYCTKNNINLLEIDGIKYQGKKLTKFLEEYFKTTDIYNNTSEISN